MKRYLIITIAVVCLLAAVGISKPGSALLKNFISLLSSESPPSAPGTLSAAGMPLDVEQTAAATHGWSAQILNSVVNGRVTFYDGDGFATATADITVYREYPHLLRVEIDWGGGVEASGFDGQNAWRQGAEPMDEEDEKDIRAFLRIWADRLFVTRAQGAPYVELGIHTEDYKPAAPGQGSVELATPVVFNQVEITDTIPGSASDETRKVYYYVDSSTSLVSALRYLEPDDPLALKTEDDPDFHEVRVDFGNWQTVNGVLWPYEITHRLGGKVDFRIYVASVQMNQSLSSSLFQGP
ncbi:MAG: hypothetical protein L0229_06720 [Blastocatellia bacterium]|nr:hypothetical protein [Blastocatellia bacterium]